MTPPMQIERMIANMPSKTGKALDEWLKIAKASKLQKHTDIVTFLKEIHGLGHGFANLAAHQLRASDGGSVAENDLVAAQYAGAKAAMRPVYDVLIGVIERLGKDVDLAPKKGYVSLRRSKQFGLIQPSTASRLDLGLNLKGVAPGPRLEAAGSFNAMVTHRIRIASARDIDAEVRAWLKAAYLQA